MIADRGRQRRRRAVMDQLAEDDRRLAKVWRCPCGGGYPHVSQKCVVCGQARPDDAEVMSAGQAVRRSRG